MKVEAGSFRTGEQKDGVRYYLHRLDGASPRSGRTLPSRPPGSRVERAAPAGLQGVYGALLAMLSLSKAHREALRTRGFSDDEIDRREYRTLPRLGRARLARELLERFAEGLLTVPGFIRKAGDDGRPYVTIAGAAGLLLPVREPAGRIVALLVRCDDPKDGGGKYSFLSSSRHGGPGPGAPPHVPLGIGSPAETVRVTEGALKADIAYALSGLPTIGAAGLAWRPALDLAATLGCMTLRLSFDADCLDNAHVARAMSDCCDGASSAGLAVELERWDRSDGKGIDDLLAAGKTPEVLTGEFARAAIREAVAVSTANEPPPEPDELDRLDNVLADGGAVALFRDPELLRALARLAEAEPAEYACRRAQLQGAGIKLRELDRALTPLRQELRRQRQPLDAAGCYRLSGGRIVREVLTNEGPIEVPLANWSGRIVEEVEHDDGAERRLTFAVEGALADGTPLPRAEVSADRFPFMRWPAEVWGTRAVVLAGPMTADHLRVALQLCSGDVPRRTIYRHLGWRKLGDRWCYLHAGGAIGPDGPAAGVDVALPDALAGFLLPPPPAGGDLSTAVRASLALFDVAPGRIMFPLLAGVYRAALGEAPGAIDFALHLAGPTGAGKSELAAHCQQHYGAGMNARNLPGAWASTGNALEGMAFAAKDALVVVDDYAPRGAASDRQRLEREADRLIRAQGNRAGRQRMRADGTLRPAKPPRGLFLSTGEDVPPGESLRGRLLVLDLSPGDLVLSGLTPHQRAAESGRYAESLSGFIRWLASQYADLSDRLRVTRAELRDRANREGHARTPGIVADLALGLQVFFDFARTIGVLENAQREALFRRAWEALHEAARAHGRHLEAAEPVAHFLRLLAGTIVSGRAHVAGPNGGTPDNPGAWGWREMGGDWVPLGRRIGWLDGNDLLLEPEAAYAEAQELARHQGEALPLQSRTLWRRLKERGILASWDQTRRRNTVRRTLGGVRDREVLHLRERVLVPGPEPSEPSAERAGPAIPREERTVSADGPADGNGDCCENRPQELSARREENPHCGRFGRSDTGGRPPVRENSSPSHKKRSGTI
jgi:hypothetical protein